MNRATGWNSRGLAFAGLLFAGFLVLNLATSARNPIIWQDEVMFADPAVNLYQGHGFTTTAWAQNRGSFFAGNVPLYSMLLYPWIATFGFGATAVRSLNYVLILAVVSIMWLTLARFGQVGTARGRGLFAALVFCGNGVAFSYRSGRYDCVGMVILAGLFAAMSIERPRVRIAMLVFLTWLVPWAGLQLIPYTVVLALILLAVRGRRSIPDVAAVAVGGMLGTASLVALLKFEGVWPQFLFSVQLFAETNRSIAARAQRAILAPLIEPSATLILAALALAWADSLRRGEFRFRSAVSIGLLLGFAVPCAMAFAGRYARYYSWMAFIPMSAALAAHFEEAVLSRRLQVATLSLAFLACVAGLPARLFVTCLEWDIRDDRSVDRFVTSYLQKTDWVFCVYEAYYPAKQAAEVVFLPFYIGQTSVNDAILEPMTHPERDRVNVIITKSLEEQRTLRFFGGQWDRVAHYEADPSKSKSLTARVGVGGSPYALSIFRRHPGPSAIDVTAASLRTTTAIDPSNQ